MNLEQAEYLAAEVCDLLKDFTTRIEVAGGIRRGKAEPHDIEVVCIPKFSPAVGMTPLGVEVPANPQNMLDGRICELLTRSWPSTEHGLEKGDPDKAGKRAPRGPRYYRVKYKGEKVDIFAVLQPAQWGNVFTIRTGDANYSHWLVQQGYKNGIIETGGHLEQTTRDAHNIPTVKVLQTPEESDFFEALGVKWIEPALRTQEESTVKQWERATEIAKGDRPTPAKVSESAPSLPSPSVKVQA